MDTDGATALQVFTDLPVESSPRRATPVLTTEATSRHWQTAVLPTGPIARPGSVEGARSG